MKGVDSQGGRRLDALIRIAAAEHGLPIQVALKIGKRLIEVLSRDGLRAIDPGAITVRGADVAFETSDIGGAEGYAAPEQLDGAPVDERSLLFSIGVILFELLAGRRLFEGAPEEVRRQILEDPPPDLGEERMDAPPELVELLFELLCNSPASRPDTLVEVAARLDELIDDRAGWEGELHLGAFLETLEPTAASVESSLELEAGEPTTRVRAEASVPMPRPQPVSSEISTSDAGTAVNRRRDALVVVLLLLFSAVIGWTARILSS